jgi:hypothetical protein
MQCVGHIDAFPPAGIDGELDNVSGLRVDLHDLQDVGERHADPLGYIRPALFTLHHSDLALRRVALKLVKRKRGRPGDHAVDGELPIRESSGLKALEGFIQGGISFANGGFENWPRGNSRANECLVSRRWEA